MKTPLRLLATLMLTLTALLTGCGQDNVDEPVPVPTTDIGAETHESTGVVRDVLEANNQISLAVEPIPSLQWSRMIRSFSVADKALLAGLEPRQTVRFQFMQGPQDEFIITAIEPVQADAKAP